MSENSSNSTPRSLKKRLSSSIKRRTKTAEVAAKRNYAWNRLLLLPLWVYVSFTASKIIVSTAVQVSAWLGVSPVDFVSQAVLQASLTAVVFLLAFIITFGMPYLVRRQVVTRELLGITRLPSWTDIGLAPLSFITYAIVTGIAVYVVSTNVPGFSADQAQDVGFNALGRRHEYLVAFVALVVIAPVAEELLFRGYLYGKLRRRVPLYAAAIATSLLFGFVHGQWNLALDTFILSLVLCGLRELTGSIWAGVLLHMLKNAIAFYILYIIPMAL